MSTLWKLSALSTPREQVSNRFYIGQQQLIEFWQSRTLLQMESILTIKQPKIIEYIWSYFSYYLFSNKKTVMVKDAYTMSQNKEILGYFYDCRIFKMLKYQKEINEMLSSFIIGYRQGKQAESSMPPLVNLDIYEFIDSQIFGDSKVIFKCKASCLLKISSLFNSLNIPFTSGDSIIITPQHYYSYIFSWMCCPPSNEIEDMVIHLFKGLMVLLQSQIIYEFSQTLTQKEKQSRRYEKPVVTYNKPKLKQTYTMVQQGLGDVEWNTLKISAFKLKYRVIEDERSYKCFRVREDEQMEVRLSQKVSYEGDEDIGIYMGFEKLRGAEWGQQGYLN